MFSRRDQAHVDLSAELNDEDDWNAGTLRSLDHYLDVTALAFEGISGLLAVGTSRGEIILYGGPGVEYRVSVPDSSVKFLHFATSLFKLLCVDDDDRLHVWDLTTQGKPKLQNIMNYRHAVNCLVLSPSHTHVFLALANGEIKTYDLLCSRNSPYVLPNMWRLYEEKMVASGISASVSAGSQIPVELAIHPRDLNLLLVAYGGGIVLSDLKERNSVRAYEYVLPPGAPGGTGLHSADLLTHRRPSVTALAIHPAGHFFAAGHADGSIVFWALEDEDKPLLARTLGQGNVQAVDAPALDELLSAKEGHEMLSVSHNDLCEPIFKLAWSGFPNSSDPRGGETVLTVLGGLKADDSPGVTSLLFPPFNPPAPPSSPDPQTTLHASMRNAMRDCLVPTKTFTYPTSSVAQDFLLIPRDSPHFSGSWDPTAILLLSDAAKDTKELEGYQFPPPTFSADPPEEAKSEAVPKNSDPDNPDAGDPSEALAEDLASVLESMKLSDEPKKLRLPPSLCSGTNGVLSGSLMKLDRDVYETLIAESASDDDAVPIRGGHAWVEDAAGEMKLMKFQPHRILITHHNDLSVRFQDLSPRLLISSSSAPLQTSFPNPLPSLTINLVSLLTDPAVRTRTTPQYLNEARIVSAYLASESLECAIVLRSGDVAVYRLTVDAGQYKEAHDNELIPLEHVLPPKGQRFHPVLMLMPGRGPLSAYTLSDVGFFAASYSDGSLFVIDMRGPKVILKEIPDTKAHRHSLLHRGGDHDYVVTMTWAACGTATERATKIRLIAIRSSGAATIYTLSRSSAGAWAVDSSREVVDTLPSPIPEGSFVIDAKTGVKCKANRSGLAAAISTPSAETPAAGRECYWIFAAAKGVRCTVNITGEKIGKADWGSKVGKVERVEIVRKSDSTVLVAFTDKRSALVCSLPFLELLHTLQLNQPSLEPLSIDETGDYIEWVRHPSTLISAAKYGTLFNIRRSGPYDPPQVDFTVGRGAIPPQPQPVSAGPPSLLSSWLGYMSSQGMTGEQVDALLGGPDRPIPQPSQSKGTSSRDTKAIQGSQASVGANTQNIASAAATGASDLYNRLGSALAERGQMLGDLQEQFDSLEQGSKNMLSQAKTLAAQQTAKRWFGF